MFISHIGTPGSAVLQGHHITLAAYVSERAGGGGGEGSDGVGVVRRGGVGEGTFCRHCATKS